MSHFVTCIEKLNDKEDSSRHMGIRDRRDFVDVLGTKRDGNRRKQAGKIGWKERVLREIIGMLGKFWEQCGNLLQ